MYSAFIENKICMLMWQIRAVFILPIWCGSQRPTGEKQVEGDYLTHRGLGLYQFHRKKRWGRCSISLLLLDSAGCLRTFQVLGWNAAEGFQTKTLQQLHQPLKIWISLTSPSSDYPSEWGAQDTCKTPASKVSCVHKKLPFIENELSRNTYNIEVWQSLYLC